MDLARLVKSDLGSLPEYIITNFIPGAQPLLRRYPRLFRFLGVLLALWYFGPLSRVKSVWSQFSNLFTATIVVTSEEDLFNYLITHLAEKRTLRVENTLTAISNPPQEDRRRRRPGDDFEEAARKPQDDTKIKYEQAQSMHVLIHDRRLFITSRTYGEGHTYQGTRYKKIENLSMTCLGRSSKPIKQFMEKVYNESKEREKTMTVIRRPFNGNSGRFSWSRLPAKPRRQLDTVILDPSQKQTVLDDIEEYMDKATAKFYGNHGIPYRRGYLFHGPPGCGKTSFCLAIAAKFNLDVYVLSLLDTNLQDSDLISLMNQLSPPSLLLLEDIDTAGLSRKRPFASTKPSGPAGRRQKNGASALAGAVSAATKGSKTNTDGQLGLDSDEEGSGPATRVSLSGLLNAIDGVASPEGHILIMTTNKPDELDDALVRAGRINVRVKFTNATKEQAKEIFVRMYVDLPQAGWAPDNVNLQDLAQKFGDAIPEDDLSPADLQDYLLVHKKDPEKALRGVDGWIAKQYEERKRKEDEKDAELRHKVMKAEKRRQQLRHDMKSAFSAEVTKSQSRADDELIAESSSKEKLEHEGDEQGKVEDKAEEKNDETTDGDAVTAGTADEKST